MKEKAIWLTIQHSRIAVLLAVLMLFLLVGAAGEVAAHGPCHANPGSVPETVCMGLPSSEAPQGQ